MKKQIGLFMAVLMMLASLTAFADVSHRSVCESFKFFDYLFQFISNGYFLRAVLFAFAAPDAQGCLVAVYPLNVVERRRHIDLYPHLFVIVAGKAHGDVHTLRTGHAVVTACAGDGVLPQDCFPYLVINR